MFAPFCPRHRARVLLFAHNIERLDRDGSGPIIRYRCHCGHRGVFRPNRSVAYQERGSRHAS